MATRASHPLQQIAVALAGIPEVSDETRRAILKIAEPIMEWQPIDTAPRDGTDILLACPIRGVVRGRWYVDEYSSTPRPYWTNDRERLFGIGSTRRDQPTHWMPLPASPNTGA